MITVKEGVVVVVVVVWAETTHEQMLVHQDHQMMGMIMGMMTVNGDRITPNTMMNAGITLSIEGLRQNSHTKDMQYQQQSICGTIHLE